MLGEHRSEPGTFVKCPWESSHTPSKGTDTSTIIWHAKPGDNLGLFACKHDHCGHRTVDEVLALFTQDELDAARQAEGLPPFKQVRPRKIKGIVQPLWEERELEHDADGVAFDDEKRNRYWGGPTDIGNAERIVAMHGENIRYCYLRSKWLVWCGTHWQWDEDGSIQRLAKQTIRSLYQVAIEEPDRDRRAKLFSWAHRSEANARVAAAITRAQYEPGISVAPKDLDADPWLFNVNNGTVDLRSGELLAHDRKNLCTRIAPVNYVSGAN